MAVNSAACKLFRTDMDIFALTETWLSDNDTAAKLEFFPTDTHNFIQQNRSGRRKPIPSRFVYFSTSLHLISSQAFYLPSHLN